MRTSGNIRLKSLRPRKDGAFEMETERVINYDQELDSVWGRVFGMTEEVTEIKNESWFSKTGQHWFRYPDGACAKDRFGRHLNENLTSLFHEEMASMSMRVMR